MYPLRVPQIEQQYVPHAVRSAARGHNRRYVLPRACRGPSRCRWRIAKGYIDDHRRRGAARCVQDERGRVSDIERRQLGGSGLFVTALGFGAMDLGGAQRAGAISA